MSAANAQTKGARHRSTVHAVGSIAVLPVLVTSSYVTNDSAGLISGISTSRYADPAAPKPPSIHAVAVLPSRTAAAPPVNSPPPPLPPTMSCDGGTMVPSFWYSRSSDSDTLLPPPRTALKVNRKSAVLSTGIGPP